MKNLENIFKVIFPLAIVIITTYYCYPFKELSEAEHLAYLKSYGTTLGLTSLGLIIGLTGGFLLAFLLVLRNRFLTMLINEYLDLIRGMPLMLLLMIFAFVVFAQVENVFFVAVIALGLNSSAYVAEIIRSGIESVDKGQMEAARSMGLSHFQAMKMIVFPQAVKNIIPALANEFISLFKETSVVAFISVVDLTFQSKIFQSLLYDPKPYIFAGVVYYASVKVFTCFVRLLEMRLKRND
ncbi:amino acid ABC transporter permease [Campylobacter sp. MG1]|uniref:amino acid ABC transporter permease n=1 Tax=unclassified Campylobacter TaxID=2593542 RepID=UPI0020245D1F|nr:MULTISPECIES: amino acid ABC transporter permease [unclassified Campylobacter]ULO03034.1 amino acid ABC transporter, permease protein [Campylobacter sp. RM12651]